MKPSVPSTKMAATNPTMKDVFEGSVSKNEGFSDIERMKNEKVRLS